MTAVAEVPGAVPRPGGAVPSDSGDAVHPIRAVSGSACSCPDRLQAGADGGPSRIVRTDRSAGPSGGGHPVRSWSLLLLAAPAAVAVWSGWVGIGKMAGFGQVHPFTGSGTLST